jgi:peptide/nickel transport system permease protein
MEAIAAPLPRLHVRLTLPGGAYGPVWWGPPHRRAAQQYRVQSTPSFVIGGTITALFLSVALVAVFWTPESYIAMSIPNRLQPPSAEHWFGTDDLGRDLLSRMLYGLRVSLVVGLLSVALAIVVGTPLGLAAGWWRRLDGPISRLTDVTLAFPFLVLAGGLAAISGPSLTNAAVALGIAQIPTMVRVVRGETLRLRDSEFVQAAVAMDASGPRILLQHVLPNCLSAVVVQATVIIPVAVLGEAVLSFLGLGIQPPTPSLGVMLSDAQQYLSRTPWPALFPGLAIIVVCLGFNLVGDALRDAIDPTSDSE